MKKLLALVLASLMLISLVACNKEKENEDDNKQTQGTEPVAEELVFENFKYVANEAGMYEISGYIPTGIDLVSLTIPSTIEGRPVTGIGESAFKASKYLQAIVIPNTITYIDNYAFYDCDYLTAVTLPESLTTIGKGAFQDCNTLATVTFSKGLTTIGEYAFMNCTVLTNITLPETLTTISEAAFYNCDALTAIVIPESVTTMEDAAFHECSTLSMIAVSDKTVNLGKSLFTKCAAELTINTPAESAFAQYVVDNAYNLKPAPIE